MDVSSLENESKKWIQSAQERVDSWKLNLSIKEVTHILLRKAVYKNWKEAPSKQFSWVKNDNSNSPLSLI